MSLTQRDVINQYVESYIDDFNPELFRRSDDEIIENLKKAIKGKRLGANNPFYGKKHTEEAKRKMSEYRKGTGNPVCQYTKDDVFVKEWRSASVAARELNGHANGIIACCRGKRKTSLGFKWRYKKDE